MSKDKDFIDEHDCCCHDEGCGCGHDHEHDHDDCDCEDTMIITLDDGTELECAVLDLFNYKGDDYIFLFPLDVEEEEEYVYPYKYIENENGVDVELEVVDDAIVDELMEEFYKKNEVDE